MWLQLKAIQQESTRKEQSRLSLTAEVFEIIPLLNVVELRKTHGDSLLYEHVNIFVENNFHFSTSFLLSRLNTAYCFGAVLR